MFGWSNNTFGQPSTSPFGQTSSNPFGAQTGFGQASTTANNPFVPKPFGSPTTTFGAQTGSSPFGATSTGAFGQPSTPAFGTTSTGAFGQPSTPAFGAMSTRAFGQLSTPAFGVTSTGAFGQQSTPSSSPFGSSTPAFGASPAPAFGATSSTFGSGALAGREFKNTAILPTRSTAIESSIHCDDHASNEPETVTRYGNGTSIERLVPKLVHADYYTEPGLGELAAKERAEPGYCSRVRDFAVGRHGYGSIKFIGETDVRVLDLESIVEFNNREVIVYKDDSKKPPVGEGLNKPAVVTLLNIKFMNKNTGEQYTEGPRVDKYREMLVKKAEEQGAEFISFDAAKGEWKFRVKHFSSYGFGEAEIGSC